MLQVTSRSSLAKTRRRAKARGFRVLNDGCGCYSVIDTKIEPPRPLVGLDHVPLWVIEQVIATPTAGAPAAATADGTPGRGHADRRSGCASRGGNPGARPGAPLVSLAG
jgi:hypothetical protein